MSLFKSAYLKTYRSGILKEKIKKACAHYYRCNLCPRMCGAERMSAQTGYCNTGVKAVVYGYHPHFGEEAPLVGENGSGTIFFSNCNLQCTFCQNFEISCQGEGAAVTDNHLAKMMLFLQNAGCHNINLVTPTHVVPQILSALELAIPQGLHIPLVYNTGGYDSIETLRLLDGIIDIYMPDFKFWNPEVAAMTCQAPDYPEVARAAVLEMYKQVGNLKTDPSGVAVRGLLMRHLVMPDNLASTREIMQFVADDISTETYVNIMAQYRPCGKAYENPQLMHHITSQDYELAVMAAREAGLTRLDKPKHVFHW